MPVFRYQCIQPRSHSFRMVATISGTLRSRRAVDSHQCIILKKLVTRKDPASNSSPSLCNSRPSAAPSESPCLEGRLYRNGRVYCGPVWVPYEGQPAEHTLGSEENTIKPDRKKTCFIHCRELSLALCKKKPLLLQWDVNDRINQHLFRASRLACTTCREKSGKVCAGEGPCLCWGHWVVIRLCVLPGRISNILTGYYVSKLIPITIAD